MMDTREGGGGQSPSGPAVPARCDGGMCVLWGCLGSVDLQGAGGSIFDTMVRNVHILRWGGVGEWRKWITCVAAAQVMRFPSLLGFPITLLTSLPAPSVLLCVAVLGLPAHAPEQFRR